MKTVFAFEIYTKCPKTGETGFDIEVGTVCNVDCRSQAIARIKQHFRLFDCVISCNQISPPVNLGKTAIHLCGSHWVDPFLILSVEIVGEMFAVVSGETTLSKFYDPETANKYCQKMVDLHNVCREINPRGNEIRIAIANLLD